MLGKLYKQRNRNQAPQDGKFKNSMIWFNLIMYVFENCFVLSLLPDLDLYFVFAYFCFLDCKARSYLFTLRAQVTKVDKCVTYYEF